MQIWIAPLYTFRHKKTPGTWAFFFGEIVFGFLFSDIWRKCVFELPLKKRRVPRRSFFVAIPLSVFFFGPPGRQSHLNFDLVHISPPKKKTGNLAYFFGETVFGYFVAPSGENANLDCDLKDILPRKKPPGTWAFFFAAKLSEFCMRPPEKIAFEFWPGAHFATKENAGILGFFL